MCTVYNVGLFSAISSLFASVFMGKGRQQQVNLVQTPEFGGLKKGAHTASSFSAAIEITPRL
jgi:hypothetical protein